MRGSDCHPNRRHYAKGFCGPCYLRHRRENDPMPSQLPSYRTNDPDRNRRYKLKAAFGLTPEEFDSLLAEQGGTCAICDGPPTGRWGRYVVDHDHETGDVRGLLCTHCNTAIGLLRDDPSIMDRAIRYLSPNADEHRSKR